MTRGFTATLNFRRFCRWEISETVTCHPINARFQRFFSQLATKVILNF